MVTALLTGLFASLGGPLGLTLDVLNPETVGGHRLLILEDVLGPRRRPDVPGLPNAEALLAFSVTPQGCLDTGLCAEVASLTERARAEGALVIAVILASKEQAAASAAAVRRARHPFPVVFDVHGLARQALAFGGPGELHVFDAQGVNILESRPSKAGDPAQVARRLEQVRQTLLGALGPLEENEP